MNDLAMRPEVDQCTVIDGDDLVRDVTRRNAIESVLLPSGSWIDRHPSVSLLIVAALILVSGAFK